MQAKETEDIGLVESLRLLFGASKAFWLVNLVNLGDGISYFGMLGLMTRFLGVNIGLSDKMTGMTMSFYTGFVTLFMIGGGYMSDWLGVRRALSWALGIMGIGRIILTAAPEHGGQWAAWFGLFLMAYGTGVLQPALYAGVKEFTDERTATVGYGILYAVMNMGIVGEYLVSPWIRTKEVDLYFTKIVGLGWGIDGVFWSCTALTGLLLLAHLSLFTKSVEEQCRVGAPPEKTIDTRSLAEKVADMPIFNPRFAYFIFILLPVRTLFAHQWLTIPDYVFRCFPKEVHDKFEWINAFNPLIIVIFVPLIAAATRKVKVIDMMIVGTFISALTTFLLVRQPDIRYLLLYIILFSLGEAAWSSRFLEYVADLAPPGKVGAYMGIAGLPWFLAKFTTGFYSGAMLSHYVPEHGAQHPAQLWLIYALVALVSPIGLVLGRKWILEGERPAAPRVEEPATGFSPEPEVESEPSQEPEEPTVSS